MLETYKSRVDKFALCEGRPSADNLYVLQVRVYVHVYIGTSISLSHIIARHFNIVFTKRACLAEVVIVAVSCAYES